MRKHNLDPIVIVLSVLFLLVIGVVILLVNTEDDIIPTVIPPYKEIECDSPKETFSTMDEYYSYFMPLLISERENRIKTGEDVSSFKKVERGFRKFCENKSLLSSPLYNCILTGNPGINTNIKRVLNSILRSPITLLQGPPGTGKTYSTVNIIKNLLSIKKTNRILVCSPSNGSLIELKERYAASPIDDTSFSIYYSTSYTNEHPTVNDDPYNIKENINKGKSVSDYNIVFVTCTSIMDRMFENQTFDFIIIDEASRCTEPECILPLLCAKESTNCLLVGDHMQLSPVIKRGEIKDCLGISLFKRLRLLNSIPIFTLNVQFRMHPYLSRLSYPYFYQDIQIADYDRDCIKEKCADWYIYKPNLADLMVDVYKRYNYSGIGPKVPRYFTNTWIDVKSKEKKEGDTYYHPQEAVETITLIENLLSTGEIQKNQITVLVPYHRQIVELRNIASKYNRMGVLDGIQIYTIDSYQGRDNDIVILSLVRSNEKGDIGFIGELERINVALTRAKFLLFVIGNKEVFRTSPPYWSEIINSHF